MTLDELLEMARWTTQDRPPRYVDADELGQGILDLLGAAQPCTMEPPEIDRASLVHPDGVATITTQVYVLDAAEARAYAAMVLRAADEAERLRREVTE